jgi:hypothetical protein
LIDFALLRSGLILAWVRRLSSAYFEFERGSRC